MNNVRLTVYVVWGLSEVLLAFTKRSRKGTTSADRGTWRVMWIMLAIGVPSAVLLGEKEIGRVRVDGLSLVAGGVALILVGMVLRWVAVATLGKFFTVDVAISSDHRVVRKGIYRWVRHPSYSGSLLSFVGFGVSLKSWASLLAVAIPVGIAFAQRIRVEERALLRTLGADYEEYCRTTKRLIPFVY